MDELYRENAKIVYCFLLSLCKKEDLAEELTQETFLRAYLSLSRYDGTCKLSVWLCQIARHLWYQYIEKHKREVPLTDDVPELTATQTPETEVLAKLTAIEALRALHQLPEQMREVMYLRMSTALSFKEIGDILGKSENWARVTYYRGKERIRKELENHDENNL